MWTMEGQEEFFSYPAFSRPDENLHVDMTFLVAHRAPTAAFGSSRGSSFWPTTVDLYIAWLVVSHLISLRVFHPYTIHT